MKDKETCDTGITDCQDNGGFEAGAKRASGCVEGADTRDISHTPQYQSTDEYKKGEEYYLGEGRDSYYSCYIPGVHAGYMDSYAAVETKPRNRTSPKQLDILEKVSQTVLKPDKALRQRLSSELGMTQRQVQIWFQNRRAKIKRMRESETCGREMKRESPRRAYQEQYEPFYAQPRGYPAAGVPYDAYCEPGPYALGGYYHPMPAGYPGMYRHGAGQRMPRDQSVFSEGASQQDLRYLYYNDIVDGGSVEKFRPEAKGEGQQQGGMSYSKNAYYSNMPFRK